MRIGIYTHNYPKSSEDRGDAGIFVSDFAGELASKHKTFIFNSSPKNGKFGNWKLTNPFSVIRFVRFFAQKKSESIKFARKNRPDFILAFWALPSGVLAYFTKCAFGIPYGVWCLGSDLNFYAKIPILRTLIKVCIKNANFRFANSDSLCAIGNDLSGKQFNFLPAVTENTNFSLKNVKLNRNNNNFLFIGRLEKVKGVDILIKAVGILNQNGINLELNILGDGTMRKYLQNLVNKNGLNKCVKFLGRADKATVFSYMKLSDYLVVPSRKESLPLVIIEAAKMGLPIIAAEVGDCGRLVRKYRIGKNFSPGDVNQLAGVLKESVSENNDKYKSGLKKLAQDFTVKKSVEMFLNYIK